MWEVGRKLLLSSLPAHDGSVECVGVSPLGKLLGAGGYAGVVKLWDAHWPTEPWLTRDSAPG